MTSLWQLNILEDSNVFGHGAINDNRENLKQLQAELNKFKRLYLLLLFTINQEILYRVIFTGSKRLMANYYYLQWTAQDMVFQEL